MALDDPKFRPAVRFTLKSIVVVLWTPIVLAFLGIVLVLLTPLRASARIEAERNARRQTLLAIVANVQFAAETRHHGDLAAALDDFARADTSRPSDPAARAVPAFSNGVTLEFATRESLAPGFDPATTWIVRERVPASLAPPFAVFGDGHVAPLEP